MLAGSTQQISDERELGIRFLAVLPRQLIAGTEIACAGLLPRTVPGVNAIGVSGERVEPLA